MSQSPRHEADGWPRLELLKAELPKPPQGTSWPELARTYATGFAVWGQLWPVVVEALTWLRGAWYGVHDELRRLREDMAGAREELLAELRKRPSVRPKAPSFSGFTPEQTVGGGTHLPAGQWESLTSKVKELAEGLEATELALEEAQQAKRDAEQRELGAKNAVAALQTADEHRRKTVLFWITVATFVGGFLGWLAVHALHL